MESLSFISDYLVEGADVKSKMARDKLLLDKVCAASAAIEACFRKGNKVLLAGNGGSAGDAQHIAAEFVSRFFFDRPGLPAIALTTDTSMLTAIGNDYGYENVFARQVQAQGVAGDIFIGISTSGNSENVVKAINVARDKGLLTVAFCGASGKLRDLADIVLDAPSVSTPYIQECHIAIGHAICAQVERAIFMGS